MNLPRSTCTSRLGPGESQVKQKDMSEPLQVWRLEVGANNEGERIDRFLARGLHFKSRSELQLLLKAGRVAVFDDWSRTGPAQIVHRSATRLRSGQLVLVTLDAPFAETNIGGEPATLQPSEVLYEDASLIAVNKPSGCALHPTRRHPRDSLVERLHRYQRELDQGSRATPCHRLDLGTSGVLLFAKTDAARRAMGAAFEERSATKLSKRYVAVVRGEPSESSGTINEPLGPDTKSSVPIRQAVDPAGRAARTHYRVVATNQSRARSKVELQPTSGRQHQLRVHLATLGHPILGDTLYLAGDEVFLRAVNARLTAEDKTLLQSNRLALHSYSLNFEHPEHGTTVEIEAPFPSELERLLDPGAGS